MWSAEPDWDRLVAEHTHGAWCHPSAEGCPELMRPQTPPVGVTRGSRTPARCAQPPRPTQTAWWLALAALLALLLAAHTLWSLL